MTVMAAPPLEQHQKARAAGLRISPTLSLPVDFVTKTCAILAQRRKGKTYTASVLAEELYAARIPFVALDPTGAWWGLRSSADGNAPGLPVVVLGGQHGDIPLERTAGRVVADLVVDSAGWYVIDFSLFESGAAERQFATDFAERLYRRKGESGKDFPLHLFVDEADRFVPQQVRGGKGEARETDQRLLGAFEAIVRRGGLRALGTTLISQRAAVVNKNVLEMLDVLIVLRNVGPNDRRAIEDYLKADADDAQRLAMMGSLAALEIGEAWVWEPGGDPPLFDRIRIRARHTFNSSATPKIGMARAEPKRLADVDLEQLRERMAATIERAKADDPRELRKRIASLETQVRSKVASPPTEWVERVVETIVEVPTLSPEDRAGIDRLAATVLEAAGIHAHINDRLEQLGQRLVAALSLTTSPTSTATTPSPPTFTPTPTPTHRRHEPDPPSSSASTSSPSPTVTSSTIPRALQRILDAVAWWYVLGIRDPDRRMVAFVAGVSSKSSGYENNISRLRSLRLIDYPGAGRLALTQAGEDAASMSDVPATRDGYHGMVMAALPPALQRLLRVLIDYHPDAISREGLANRAGVSAASSGYENNISRLRSLGLIDYPDRGMVRAADMLFVLP